LAEFKRNSWRGDTRVNAYQTHVDALLNNLNTLRDSTNLYRPEDFPGCIDLLHKSIMNYYENELNLGKWEWFTGSKSDFKRCIRNFSRQAQYSQSACIQLKISYLERSNSHKSQRHQQAIASLNNEHEQVITELHDKHKHTEQTMTQTIEELRGDNYKLKREKRSLVAEVKRLRAELETLTATHQRVTTSIEAHPEAKPWLDKIAGDAKEIAEQIKLIEALQKENEELRSELKELRNEFEVHEQNTKELRQKFARFQEKHVQKIEEKLEFTERSLDSAPPID